MSFVNASVKASVKKQPSLLNVVFPLPASFLLSLSRDRLSPLVSRLVSALAFSSVAWQVCTWTIVVQC